PIGIRTRAVTEQHVFNQTKASAGADPLKQAGFADIDRFEGMVVNLATPWITPPGTTDIGNRGDSIRGNPDWSLAGSLTWIKGNHNLKGGAQVVSVDRLQINRFQTFGFSNLQTS